MCSYKICFGILKYILRLFVEKLVLAKYTIYLTVDLGPSMEQLSWLKQFENGTGDVVQW
jgi:hypothetical protein